MNMDPRAEFVFEQLRAHDPAAIEARRMFGSLGLYRDGDFFGILHRGTLYLRTDDATRPEYEARGMGPFRPNSRQTLKNYYEVPADILDDPELLAAWVQDAVLAGLSGR
jgi:DNA transformation protein